MVRKKGGESVRRATIRSTFTELVFSRVHQIRRHLNDFEDKLSGRYGQPQTIPVPDELDPAVPRVMFQSLGGHSQIVISQMSITLNVTYDGEWVRDASKRASYLLDRVPLVHELCKVAGAEPAFTGLNGRARLASSASDANILDKLVGVLGIKDVPGELSELSLRMSSIVDHQYFDNVTIQSYRQWSLDDPTAVRRLPSARATSRGIELIQDFNDRYAYNEQSDYLTSAETGALVVGTRMIRSAHGYPDSIRNDG